jgi:hypothetical protein
VNPAALNPFIVPAKSVLIDLRTGYVWQPIGRPSGSADKYRVPRRTGATVAPAIRKFLRFIMYVIPLDVMEQTITDSQFVDNRASHVSRTAAAGNVILRLIEKWSGDVCASHYFSSRDMASSPGLLCHFKKPS